eukprot:scaffold20925_cov18-Prasinocladus_malaysianus.AAC.1
MTSQSASSAATVDRAAPIAPTCMFYQLRVDTVVSACQRSTWYGANVVDLRLPAASVMHPATDVVSLRHIDAMLARRLR